MSQLIVLDFILTFRFTTAHNFRDFFQITVGCVAKITTFNERLLWCATVCKCKCFRVRNLVWCYLTKLIFMKMEKLQWILWVTDSSLVPSDNVNFPLVSPKKAKREGHRSGCNGQPKVYFLNKCIEERIKEKEISNQRLLQNLIY